MISKRAGKKDEEIKKFSNCFQRVIIPVSLDWCLCSDHRREKLSSFVIVCNFGIRRYLNKTAGKLGTNEESCKELDKRGTRYVSCIQRDFMDSIILVT